jgi:hypothetical protein
LKAGRRNSFFIQGKVLYQKLPGSMDQVTYTGLRAPVTIGWRLDFAPTTRKTVTKVITNYPPPIQNTTKPAPAPEVIRPEQPVRKDTLNVPVPQIETEKPVVPIQPAISADDFLNKPIGDLKTYKYGELTLLLDKVVKEENYLMAEEIQKEIEARENKADMNEIPADRLNQLLKIAIDKEDYVRAALIQEEINRRK